MKVSGRIVRKSSRVGVPLKSMELPQWVVKSNKKVSKAEKAKVAAESRLRWIDETRQSLLDKKNDAEELMDAHLTALDVTYERERPIDVGGSISFMDFHVSSIYKSRLPVHCSINIEIDGSTHNGKEAKKRDSFRNYTMLNTNSAKVVVRMPHSTALKMTKEDLWELLRSCAALPKCIISVLR